MSTPWIHKTAGQVERPAMLARGGLALADLALQAAHDLGGFVV